MISTEVPKTHSRREMRKALIRLRMEMHRQEIRHESRQLLHPLQRMRERGNNWQANLGIKHAPLWGMGIVTLLGFFTGKSAKGANLRNLSRVLKIGTTLIPLIKLAMQGSSSKP
jgi:hypothetical protein